MSYIECKQIDLNGWPIFISKVGAHEMIKDNILELLSKEKSKKLAYITNSDWPFNDRCNRKYLDYIKPFVEPIINNVITRLEYDKIGSKYTFLNCWFHQYYTNSYCGWHTHPACQFANVYYVELPDKTGTQFLKSFANNEIFQPEVEEGTILTFPSQLIHSSPINMSKERKTVISFNIDLQ
jgi:hypothetical protein